MTIVRLLLIALSLFGLSFKAYSSLLVQPMVVDTAVSEVKHGASLTVVNEDKHENAYVSLKLKKVLNPGTKNEQEITIDNPKKYGVYVTPKKMIIAPGASKKVRIGFIKSTNKTDNVYRVVVEPSVSLQQQLNNELSTTAGVNILIAYGVLVIQRPVELDSKLSLQRHGKQITVTNQGNTSIMLTDARQCQAKDNCKALPATKRLYAGKTWHFTVPEALPLQIVKEVAGRSEYVQSN